MTRFYRFCSVEVVKDEGDKGKISGDVTLQIDDAQETRDRLSASTVRRG